MRLCAVGGHPRFDDVLATPSSQNPATYSHSWMAPCGQRIPHYRLTAMYTCYVNLRIFRVHTGCPILACIADTGTGEQEYKY